MPNQATVKRIMEDRGLFDPRDFFHYRYDFHGDAGDTLENPWTTEDTSATGTPTLDFVTDVPDGVYQLKHDSTAEAQDVGLHWGDHLAINLSKAPVVEFRAKVAFASGGVLGSADQRVVLGLASNFASTLDNVTTNAWFRIDGNNADLLIEGDDGTTDTDDEDSDLDLSDDTFTRFLIDFGDLSAVKFYVDGEAAGTVDISGVSANTKVQPLAIVQRDGGSEQEDLRLDYFDLVQERS